MKAQTTTLQGGGSRPVALLRRLTAALPHGRTLPERAWLRRHHALLLILWLHVPGLTIFALLEGYSLVHSILLHGAVLASFALFATFAKSNRRVASAAVSLGLITASALLVHTWHGVIEGHFHFFVMIALLALYEDWVPFLLAAAYVVIHHGVTGAIDPGAVYNHPDAVAHPWKWAAIHGLFVTAAGIASVAAWRLNEDVRAETREAYRQARKSEERFKSAFDDAPIGMALSGIGTEDAGRLVQVNRALCRLLGYPEDELVGAHFHRITHAADLEENAAFHARLLAGEIPSYQLEKRYIHANGHLVWGLLSVSLVRDESGEARYAIAQVEDINERKHAEWTVRQSQRQLAEAQKLAHIGSWEWDLATGEVTWTEELYRILGLDPETWRPSYDGFFERVHPDERERVDEVVQASLAQREPFRDQYRVIRPDGEQRVIATYGEVVIGDDGEPAKLVGTAQDVTEQSRAELYREVRYAVATGLATAKSLDEVAPELLESLMSTGLWELAAFWAVDEQRQALERLALRGTNSHESQASELVGAPGELVRKTWLTGEPALQTAETDGLHSVAAFPVMGHGTVLGVIEFFSRTSFRPDSGKLELMATVTGEIGHFVESKRFERELLLKQEAERDHQSRSEFLSRISHELRTPLNAILGFAQVLELGDLDPDEQESVRQILKGGTHLLELINEVLEISRVESGNMSVSLEPVRIAEIVSDVLDLVGPLAAQHQVTLHNDLAEQDGRHIHADKQRLKQVMLNLLSNGIKYNREGGTVTVTLHDVPGDRVILMVTDTGRGIPEHKLAQVFSPFDRLGAEQTSIEGTGLGLTLSKLLVEAMGGTLEVESEPWVGSTFMVGLPATEEMPDDAEATRENGAAAAVGVDESREVTILYVEDNLSNFKLVERLLDERGNARLLTAMEGNLGLELARQHLPDLILLDLHLPIMDGQEMLSRLKADPATRHIPVIVVSADATQARVEQLLATGAEAFLTKPLDVRRFVAVVDDALSEQIAA